MTIETVEQRAERIVRQEVLCCMSSIVSTLAGGYGNIGQNRPDNGLADMAEQAFELASPVSDFEEAAIQAGWSIVKGGCELPDAFRNPRLQEAVDMPEDAIPEASPADACGWENLCEEYGLDPYEHEVFEHWAVSSWLAEKLREQGEKVDDDFGNLCVWARTTTGQGIAADGVLLRIAREVLA